MLRCQSSARHVAMQAINRCNEWRLSAPIARQTRIDTAAGRSAVGIVRESSGSDPFIQQPDTILVSDEDGRWLAMDDGTNGCLGAIKRDTIATPFFKKTVSMIAIVVAWVRTDPCHSQRKSRVAMQPIVGRSHRMMVVAARRRPPIPSVALGTQTHHPHPRRGHCVE